MLPTCKVVAGAVTPPPLMLRLLPMVPGLAAKDALPKVIVMLLAAVMPLPMLQEPPLPLKARLLKLDEPDKVPDNVSLLEESKVTVLVEAVKVPLLTQEPETRMDSPEAAV